MDDADDFEVDPAIAEAMGFSGFGMGKKRKFNPNDGFVDPDANASKTPVDRANTSHMPARKQNPEKSSNAKTQLPERVTTVESSESSAREAGAGTAIAQQEEPTLEQLRHGVRDENGDIAYFLPSFLEDPWKDLKPQ